MNRKFENEAKELCDAIRSFANNPESVDNFESYLSLHFETWLSKYANTPENIASEFKQFASIR